MQCSKMRPSIERALRHKEILRRGPAFLVEEDTDAKTQIRPRQPRYHLRAPQI
jgi:hypothetical protein